MKSPQFRLLEMRLSLSGAIVTMMQWAVKKRSASKIIERKGDYCSAVKGNQTNASCDELKNAFDSAMSHLTDSPTFAEARSQRLRRRSLRAIKTEKSIYDTMPVPKNQRQRGLGNEIRRASVGTITYESFSPDDWGEGDGEVRYFIMSFTSDAEAVWYVSPPAIGIMKTRCTGDASAISEKTNLASRKTMVQRTQVASSG